MSVKRTGVKYDVYKNMTIIERLNSLPEHCINVVFKQVMNNSKLEEQLKDHSGLTLEFTNTDFQLHLILSEYYELCNYYREIKLKRICHENK